MCKLYRLTRLAFRLSDPDVQKQAALFSANPDIGYEYTLISNIYSGGLPPIEAGSVVAEKAVEILNSKVAGNRLENILDERDQSAVRAGAPAT